MKKGQSKEPQVVIELKAELSNRGVVGIWLKEEFVEGYNLEISESDDERRRDDQERKGV